MSLRVTDIGLLFRVAILEAIVENSCVASLPEAPSSYIHVVWCLFDMHSIISGILPML